MKKNRSYRQWFTLFFINNVVFLSLQLGFVFSDSSTFINAIPLPASIYFELIATLLIYIILYLLLSVLQTLLIWGITQWHLSIASLERWHIFNFTIGPSIFSSHDGFTHPQYANFCHSKIS